MTMTKLRVSALVALAVLGFGCDRLGLGLGKKDADGGAAASGGTGGLLSFLDKSFEGEIAMNAIDSTGGVKGAPKTFVFGIKSPKVRIDASGDVAPGNPMLAQGVSLIIDPPAKKAYALLPPKKQAVVIDLDKAKSMKMPTLPTAPGRPAAPAPTQPTTPPKIENTGKKDTVAGYQCEVWKITEPDGKHADACLADGITWIDLTGFGMQSPVIAAAAGLSAINHFPLRLVSYDARNVEQARFEATKIDKKKLDDSRFVVPPGYQIIDMAAMMGAFMGAPPGALGAPGATIRPGVPPRGLPPGFTPPKPH
jgi:hypothetical protein